MTPRTQGMTCAMPRTVTASLQHGYAIATLLRHRMCRHQHHTSQRKIQHGTACGSLCFKCRVLSFCTLQCSKTKAIAAACSIIRQDCMIPLDMQHQALKLLSNQTAKRRSDHSVPIFAASTVSYLDQQRGHGMQKGSQES